MVVVKTMKLEKKTNYITYIGNLIGSYEEKLFTVL